MNKSFEIEYKKFAGNNVPNLWDRIEEGIDKLEAAEKSAAKVNEENSANENVKSNVIDFREFSSDDNVKKEKSKKTVIINYISTHGVQVIAAVCSIFIIPGVIILAVRNSGNFSMMESATSAPMADSAAPAYDEATYESDACAEEALDAAQSFNAEEFYEESADAEEYAPAEEVAEAAVEEVVEEETMAEEAAEEVASSEAEVTDEAPAETSDYRNRTKSANADTVLQCLSGVLICVNAVNDDGTFEIKMINDPGKVIEENEILTVTMSKEAKDAYDALSDAAKESNLMVDITVNEDEEITYTIVAITAGEKGENNSK